MSKRIDVIKKSLNILPACLLFVACGKKPINSSSSDDIVLNEELNTNVAVGITFNGDSDLTSKSHMFERDAQVKIPEVLHVKSGKPLYYEVRVHFNSNHSPEQRDNGSEIVCSYQNLKLHGEAAKNSPTGYDHRFEGCFQDLNGNNILEEHENLDYKVGQQIFQERWRYVRVDLVRGFTYDESEIYTEFEINWF